MQRQRACRECFSTSRSTTCILSTRKGRSSILQMHFPEYTQKKHSLSMTSWPQETLADTSMQKLAKYIKEGWPKQEQSIPSDLKPYFPLRDEVVVKNDVILKGQRAVIPAALRKAQRPHGGWAHQTPCLWHSVLAQDAPRHRECKSPSVQLATAAELISRNKPSSDTLFLQLTFSTGKAASTLSRLTLILDGLRWTLCQICHLAQWLGRCSVCLPHRAHPRSY